MRIKKTGILNQKRVGRVRPWWTYWLEFFECCEDYFLPYLRPCVTRQGFFSLLFFGPTVGTWDLSSAIRDQTCVPFSRSLNHWTATEAPSEGFLIIARLTYTSSVFTKTKPAPNSPRLYADSPSLPDSPDPRFPWLWLSWHGHPKIWKGGRYSPTPSRDSAVQASQNNPDFLGIPACCKLPPNLGANYCP